MAFVSWNVHSTPMAFAIFRKYFSVVDGKQRSSARLPLDQHNTSFYFFSTVNDSRVAFEKKDRQTINYLIEKNGFEKYFDQLYS